LKGSLDLLDIEPEVTEAPGAIAIGRARGDIAFENVSFAYQRRKSTLEDISFSVPAGTRLALVGPTGAGKTTLVSLLARLYDPHRGRVLIDGSDIRTLKLASLRDQISVVLELLPHGYQTVVGEKGAGLSGGERQRIAVARAFIRDAPILILDEPTSSIDSKTEAVILDALDLLMEGRTSVMIAHRLSTIRDAQFIIVLNQGRIVEQGTHDELVERRGLYRQLYDAQVRARRPKGVRELMVANLPGPARESDVDLANRLRDALYEPRRDGGDGEERR
jgi:ABC-type multidrug transport system fused ATPase/permease subunit